MIPDEDDWRMVNEVHELPVFDRWDAEPSYECSLTTQSVCDDCGKSLTTRERRAKVTRCLWCRLGER